MGSASVSLCRSQRSVGNDALQPGNRLGFGDNLEKRTPFIKDKSSEIVGLIYSFISSKSGVGVAGGVAVGHCWG